MVEDENGDMVMDPVPPDGTRIRIKDSHGAPFSGMTGTVATHSNAMSSNKHACFWIADNPPYQYSENVEWNTTWKYIEILSNPCCNRRLKHG